MQLGKYLSAESYDTLNVHLFRTLGKSKAGVKWQRDYVSAPIILLQRGIAIFRVCVCVCVGGRGSRLSVNLPAPARLPPAARRPAPAHLASVAVAKAPRVVAKAQLAAAKARYAVAKAQ